jgi:transposase
MAYNEKFKISVAQFHLRGNTVAITAETFGVGGGRVSDWTNEFKRTGRIETRVRNRESTRLITEEKIESFLKRSPDGNQNEMAEAFGCTNQSVCIALKKFGYTRKKNGSYMRSLTQ